MAKKPTEAQRKVLMLLSQRNGCYCTHMAVYGSGFSIRVAAATVRALDRAGWIALMSGERQCFQITALGRAALTPPSTT